MKVLFATTNPAKIKKYADKLKEKDIEILTIKDLGINLKPEETGKNAIENAYIKAKAYYDKTKVVSIGMDNNLYIEGLPEEKQPGTHVRRINGKELNDEEMIEYHRLCGNREINFWRLSNQKNFTNFHVGDLLFFYTKVAFSNKKAFAGYAHFNSSRRMSIAEMWKRYNTSNGYDSIDKLTEAIQKASRDKPLPKKMDCLYLKEVVFFNEPVFPEEVGIDISSKLESYCYIDKNDPEVTIRILRKAEEHGIDLWSSAYSKETEEIFKHDEIRQGLCGISKMLGKTEWTESERKRAIKLMSTFVKKNSFHFSFPFSRWKIP